MDLNVGFMAAAACAEDPVAGSKDGSTSALQEQVGGDHYKSLRIQPVEYIHANGLGFCEGSVIKYVTRWRAKGGIPDLEKARHFIDLLIELEKKRANDEAQIELAKTAAPR